jgi:hypothetical protein
MKKLIAAISLFVFVQWNEASAQITYEHTYQIQQGAQTPILIII